MQQDTASMVDGLDFESIAAPVATEPTAPVPPNHDEPVIRGYDLEHLD
jgi:hypothetical protein